MTFDESSQLLNAIKRQSWLSSMTSGLTAVAIMLFVHSASFYVLTELIQNNRCHCSAMLPHRVEASGNHTTIERQWSREDSIREIANKIQADNHAEPAKEPAKETDP